MARTPYALGEGSPAPTPSAQTEPTAPERIDATPGQFGGLLGAGEQQAGATVEQTGEKAAQISLQLANFYNEANAQGAENQWADAATKILYDPQTGLYSKRGIDAQSAWPAAQAALQLSRNQIAANLPNDRQKLLFDQLTRRTYDYHLMGAARYVDQQQEGYADAQWKAGAALKESQALSHAGDEDQWQGDLQDALNRTEAYLKYKGQSPEVIQDQKNAITSRMYGQRIALEAVHDPRGADALFQANRDKLEPQLQIQLEKALKGRVDDEEASDWVSANVGGLPGQAGASAVWDRIKKQESGNRQFDSSGKLIESKLVGGDDPIGISQIKPSTARGVAASLNIPFDEQKLRTDPVYNEMLGRAYHQQMVTQYGSVLLGTAAYDAGPAKVDKWIHDYGDPRTGAISEADFVSKIPLDETRNYVRSVGAVSAAPTAPAQGTMPDKSAVLQKAVTQFGNDPERLGKVVQKINSQFSMIEGVTATERMALTRDQDNTQKALQDGLDIPNLPDIENRIRAVFPPEEAARRTQLLEVSKYAGILYSGVKWGTPEEINQAVTDATSSTGVTGALIRARLASGKAPAVPGAEPDTAVTGETAEAYTLRRSIASEMGKMAAERQDRLTGPNADPAAYVAAHPLVAAAHAAIDPQNPKTFEKWAEQSRAVQTQLGVPTAQQHLLTKAEAAGRASQFTTLDPKEGDAGALLGTMATADGKEWPAVFGDMVTLGKLPGQYQILAAMPDPTQRAEFQRALQTMALKGGIEKLKGDAPKADVQSIDDGIDDQMREFNKTAMLAGRASNVDLVSNVKNSIKAFAYYKAMQGNANALRDATDAILNNKYDFPGSGTMQNVRVPKGMTGIMQQSAQTLLDRLTPDQIGGNLGGFPDLTPDQLKERTLAAARGSGARWLTNENDTGMYLSIQGRDGSVQSLRGADGKRIELPFAASAPLPPAMPGPTMNPPEVQGTAPPMMGSAPQAPAMVP